MGDSMLEPTRLGLALPGLSSFKDFRQECKRHLPNTEVIEPDQAPNAFLYLKSRFSM